MTPFKPGRAAAAAPGTQQRGVAAHGGFGVGDADDLAHGDRPYCTQCAEPTASPEFPGVGIILFDSISNRI